MKGRKRGLWKQNLNPGTALAFSFAQGCPLVVNRGACTQGDSSHFQGSMHTRRQFSLPGLVRTSLHKSKSYQVLDLAVDHNNLQDP